MARIVFAWELGGDRGHLSKILPIALELERRGHELYLISRNLKMAQDLFQKTGISIFQAPIVLGQKKPSRMIRSIPEILLINGYANTLGLSALHNAWENLFQLISPDALVCDYAPTAMLASRGLNIPKIVMGASFCAPSPGWPPVDYMYWKSGDVQSILVAEKQCIASANSVLGAKGLPLITYTSDLFQAMSTYLFHPRDFDLQAGSRANTEYLAPMEAPGGYQITVWPQNGKKKIFAYLKRRFDLTEPVIAALKASGQNIVCYVDQASVSECEEWTSNGAIFSCEPYDIAEVAGNADLIVSHGGVGLVSWAIYNGIPQLMAPTQIEQLHNALCVEKLGLGHWLDKHDTVDSIERALYNMINNENILDRVKRVSERYRSNSDPHAERLIADKLEASFSMRQGMAKNSCV